VVSERFWGQIIERRAFSLKQAWIQEIIYSMKIILKYLFLVRKDKKILLKNIVPKKGGASAWRNILEQ
jgi:hypothetical protein